MATLRDQVTGLESEATTLPEIADLADRTGLSVESMQSLQVVARDIGVDEFCTTAAFMPDEQSVLGARAGTPSDDTATLRIVLPPEDLA